MWIKNKIDSRKWTDYYSKIPGYTLLEQDKDGVWVGYCGVSLTEGALEITNTDELLKIQRHREVAHYYPQPMEKTNIN